MVVVVVVVVVAEDGVPWDCFGAGGGEMAGVSYLLVSFGGKDEGAVEK